jgi:hypothetical protein
MRAATLVGLALVVASCNEPRAISPASAPSLVLTDTAGGHTTLPEDYARSTLTAIVFFSDHCPCFRVHEERLVELARTYAPRGVRMIFVDSEVSGSLARDAHVASERGLPAISLDPGAKLADALDADYATYTVVVDEKGRVRYRGGIDSDKDRLHDDTKAYLRDALDDLLAGHEPRIAEGKALGCALRKR